MAKHTPGPWQRWVGHAEVFAGVSENERGQIAGKKLLRVAACDSDEIDEDEQIANATLLAAAPDLLAACKAVVEEDGFRGSCLMRKRIDAMRQAIAKAEGES